jgi:hypothetical protein
MMKLKLGHEAEYKRKQNTSLALEIKTGAPSDPC